MTEASYEPKSFSSPDSFSEASFPSVPTFKYSFKSWRYFVPFPGWDSRSDSNFFLSSLNRADHSPACFCRKRGQSEHSLPLSRLQPLTSSRLRPHHLQEAVLSLGMGPLRMDEWRGGARKTSYEISSLIAQMCICYKKKQSSFIRHFIVLLVRTFFSFKPVSYTTESNQGNGNIESNHIVSDLISSHFISTYTLFSSKAT